MPVVLYQTSLFDTLHNLKEAFFAENAFQIQQLRRITPVFWDLFGLARKHKGFLSIQEWHHQWTLDFKACKSIILTTMKEKGKNRLGTLHHDRTANVEEKKRISSIRKVSVRLLTDKMFPSYDRIYHIIWISLFAYIGVLVRATTTYLSFQPADSLLPLLGASFFLPNIVGSFLLGV